MHHLLAKKVNQSDFFSLMFKLKLTILVTAKVNGERGKKKTIT